MGVVGMKTFFISSTFKDMQAERDILQEKVFPRLRKLAAEYGEDVSELDLRWGVDTMNLSEEESGKQVLKVCIDAIDRCTPYFIVLLGERYGWIPAQNIVDSVHDTRIDKHYQAEMSITNLEIQYGAFERAEVLDKCVFCFRNPSVMQQIEPEYRHIYEAESSCHAEKLQSVKEKIRSIEQANMIEYSASWNINTHKMEQLDELAENLYQVLAEMLKQELSGEKAKNWKEQIILEAKRTKDEHLSTYVQRTIDETEFIQHFEQIILAGTFRVQRRELYDKFLYIQADAGVGKSAFMSRMAKVLEEQGYSVVSYFGGNHGCQGSRTLKEVLAYEFETLAEISHEDVENIDERLGYLNQFFEEGNVVCFVDALDQLLEFEPEYVVNLQELCPRVIFVFSSLSNFTARFQQGAGIINMSLATLTKEQARSMIILTAEKRGKKIDDLIIEKILKRPNNLNPLQLSLVLQRFFMMSGVEFEKAETMAPGMQGIHAYMEQLLGEMPVETEKMILYLFHEVTSRFGDSNLLQCINMIAMSDHGLSENELKEILYYSGEQFETLKFMQLISYLYDAFQQTQEGKWGFAHRLYLESVRGQITENQKTKIDEMFSEYALHNREFCVKKGYQLLFDKKEDRGYQVFEMLTAEDNIMHICAYIQDSLEDSSYDEYYLNLAKTHPSNPMCKFWNESFGLYTHGEKSKELRVRILEEIVKCNEISDYNRYQICMRIADGYIGESDEKAAQYIEKLEQLLKNFSENDLFLRKAEYHYIKSFLIGHRNVENAKKDAANERKIAFDYINRVRKSTLTADEMRIKASIYTDCFYDTGNPELVENLLPELESYECTKYQVLTRIRIEMYGRLVVYYTKQNHFSAEKFNFYRDRAMSVGKELIKKIPSRQNYRVYMEMLLDIQNMYKEGYRDKVLKEAIEIGEKIQQLEDELNIRTLMAYAYACLAYDFEAERRSAVENCVAIKCHQKSYELYEELYQKTGKPWCGLYQMREASGCLRAIKRWLGSAKLKEHLDEIIEWGLEIYKKLETEDFENPYLAKIYQYDTLETIAELYIRYERKFEDVDQYISELQRLNMKLYEQKPTKKREFNKFKLKYYQMLVDYELYKDDQFVAICEKFVEEYEQWKTQEEYFKNPNYIYQDLGSSTLTWEKQAMALSVVSLAERGQEKEALSLNKKWMAETAHEEDFDTFKRLKRFLEGDKSPFLCTQISWMIPLQKRWSEYSNPFTNAEVNEKKKKEAEARIHKQVEYFESYIGQMNSTDDSLLKGQFLMRALCCACWDNIYPYELLLGAVWEKNIEFEDAQMAIKKFVRVLSNLSKMRVNRETIPDERKAREILMKLRWYAARLFDSFPNDAGISHQLGENLSFFFEKELDGFSVDELKAGVYSFERKMEYMSQDVWKYYRELWYRTYCGLLVELYVREKDFIYVEKFRQIKTNLLEVQKRLGAVTHDVYKIMGIVLESYRKLVLIEPDVWKDEYTNCLKKNIEMVSVPVRKENLIFMKKNPIFYEQVDEMERMAEDCCDVFVRLSMNMIQSYKEQIENMDDAQTKKWIQQDSKEKWRETLRRFLDVADSKIDKESEHRSSEEWYRRAMTLGKAVVERTQEVEDYQLLARAYRGISQFYQDELKEKWLKKEAQVLNSICNLS